MPLAVRAEYAGGSEVFRTKIAGLEQAYMGMRRASGDGNCFFRSFIFAYFEDILLRKDFTERHRCFWGRAPSCDESAAVLHLRVSKEEQEWAGRTSTRRLHVPAALLQDYGHDPGGEGQDEGGGLRAAGV